MTFRGRVDITNNNAERPYYQRFYGVKPCPKEMKCDVEVSSYAVRDIEEYRNFCDRPKDQRPQPDEVLKDMAEHLNTVYLSACERGRHCLYEGSTLPEGFPNSWNGASKCMSELTIYKNGEVHCWDCAYDDNGNHVWGVKQGPYEFTFEEDDNDASIWFLDHNYHETMFDVFKRINGSLVFQRRHTMRLEVHNSIHYDTLELLPEVVA